MVPAPAPSCTLVDSPSALQSTLRPRSRGLLMTFMLKRDMLQTRGRRKWSQIGFAVKHSAGLAAMSMGARAKREAENRAAKG